MRRNGHVLIIDDQQEWRDEPPEILVRAGYNAVAVPTVSDALTQLDQNIYHVMIVDIRMDASDQSNVEGIDLLKQLEQRGLNEATKVIMLSSYGDMEKIRIAFRDYDVADFMEKRDFNKATFLKTVERVFTDKVKINLDLEIHWQENSTPQQAVQHLLMSDALVESDAALQQQMVDELEDLLCRLFHKARSVLVRPMKDGRSGTNVLRVQPFYNNGGGHAVVVKFGDVHLVQKEYDNYVQCVQTYLGGGRNTAIQEVRRTPHLGGIIYSLLGTTHEQLMDFGEFYASYDIDSICGAIDKLLFDTCDSWYASRGSLQILDLTESYQRTLNGSLDTLARAAFDRLHIAQTRERLYFLDLSDSSARSFINPLTAITGKVFARATFECITHGDFHHHNILVDKNGHIWLIDFQETARSHILRDVAILDAVVRFQLLPAEKATLEERLRMEEALCSITRFSQVNKLTSAFTTKNQELAHAYDTVVHLRKTAAKLVELNPEDDIDEYYIALLYTALNTLRYSSLSPVQLEHALLSASLLAGRLSLAAVRP
jgi:FixJ family two-component response regulator